MTVTYNIDDTYCPKGHKWIFVSSSLLFGDYYFCKDCDKIFQPTVKELSPKWFKKQFVSDRMQELKKLAFIVEARKKVKTEDLIKLGYLEK